MKNSTLIVLGIILLHLFSACELINQGGNEQDEWPQSDYPLYVLCEGLFNLNNGTLAYWNGQDEPQKDWFRQKNGRGLGDTPNDIKAYGNKLYLVVNVSSQVEVVDAKSGKSLKQIPLFTEDGGEKENGRARQPRYIAFHQDKAYISCYDGTVARLDTASLCIDGNLKVGRHPEGLAVAKGKLYVANSGGLDNPNYDKTLSVIDLESFTEIKRIEVAINPYKVYADSQGDIYVNSRGDYNAEDYLLQRIDTDADTLAETFHDLQVLNFTIQGNTAYLYDFDFSSKYSKIFVMDMEKDEIIRENFITDGSIINTPYGLSLNPFNGDVFIADAYDYLQTGDILCFSPEGELKYRLKDIGLNPNAVVVVDP